MSPRIGEYNDSQDGLVSVIYDDAPVWPWFLCGFLCTAFVFMLGIAAWYFSTLARPNPPTTTPVIEEHAP